jgi:hypothetical protein
MSIAFQPALSSEHMQRGVFYYTHSTGHTTNLQCALERKAEVRELIDNWVEVKTYPIYAENLKNLRKVVQPGDLVWSYAGDSGPRVAAQIFSEKAAEDPANINRFTLVADDGGGTSLTPKCTNSGSISRSSVCCSH